MKILIVDDDFFNLRLMSDILSPVGSCDTAKDGINAIVLFQKALAEGQPYDLVCLDIVMPGMDGHQVLKQIRFIEECMGVSSASGVKIIMVTSKSDVDTILKSYNHKCDVYITKPINKSVIIEKLKFMGLLA